MIFGRNNLGIFSLKVISFFSDSLHLNTNDVSTIVRKILIIKMDLIRSCMQGNTFLISHDI